MAKLKDKVQTALDENRLLVLGGQVLLGIQLRTFFESGFDKLPRPTQLLKLGGMGAMVIALALLLAPSAYHRLVEGGEDTPRLMTFMGRVMWPALLPFVAALSIDIFVAGQKVLGTAAGVVLALVALGIGLTLLHGLEAVMRRRRAVRIEEVSAMTHDEEQEGSSLDDKIRHVLTEARLVLPGAQALLGFQFVTILTEAFDKLPAPLKEVHLFSLGCVALSVIFLLTPAAYHRIVERGESTRHIHRFASIMVLAATVPLGLGVAGDVLVVTWKVLRSTTAAGIAAAATLAVTYGLWFGVTLLARRKRSTAYRLRGRSAAAA
jgi:hypothetical protein